MPANFVYERIIPSAAQARKSARPHINPWAHLQPRISLTACAKRQSGESQLRIIQSFHLTARQIACSNKVFSHVLCRAPLQILRWMESAAYVAASRVGRGGRHLLTASMDSIAFRHPTRVGDILYVSAQVPRRRPLPDLAPRRPAKVFRDALCRLTAPARCSHCACSLPARHVHRLLRLAGCNICGGHAGHASHPRVMTAGGSNMWI